MPKGASAAGFPLPVMNNGNILFWGGVDGVTASYKDQRTNPGIMKEVLIYTIGTDTWSYIERKENIMARVTLPVVYWKGSWVYISGEVKPGVRTNSVYAVNN